MFVFFSVRMCALCEQPGVHGSSGTLSVASDVLPQQHTGGPLIPSISCRSTVSDTEYEKVSVFTHRSQVMLLELRE